VLKCCLYTIFLTKKGLRRIEKFKMCRRPSLFTNWLNRISGCQRDFFTEESILVRANSRPNKMMRPNQFTLKEGSKILLDLPPQVLFGSNSIREGNFKRVETPTAILS